MHTRWEKGSRDEEKGMIGHAEEYQAQAFVLSRNLAVSMGGWFRRSSLPTAVFIATPVDRSQRERRSKQMSALSAHLLPTTFLPG